jgi:hypothetical protein
MTLTYEQEERFFKKVNKTDTCWLWTAYVQQNGYGQVRINKKAYSAHRVSYMHHNKTEIPEGLCVCHSCDVPACVNPDHLFLGTHQDNMDDRTKKGRAQKRDGDKCPTCKLTKEQVLEIAALFDTHTNLQLGKEYDISKSTISHIRTGRAWSTVTGIKLREREFEEEEEDKHPQTLVHR